MASIKQHGEQWRAQVCVRGVRDSRVFRTRREASAWALAREDELRSGHFQDKHTLGEALAKYAAEVSVRHRGERWERIRLAALVVMPHFPAAKLMAEVTTGDLAVWRDHRIDAVSAGTVLREIGLLSSVFETARKEWGWITENPLRDLKKPRHPDHREVVIRWGQIKALLRALGWRSGPVKSTRQAVGMAFLLALRTGMRAGELCGLTWENMRGDYCVLPATKTRPRNVPIEPKAQRLIARMVGWDGRLVFGVGPQTLDSVFRRARKAAGIAGMTFHDSRHTAATRLARRLDVLDLCKMFGWSNPGMAMVYYNPTASEIARRIAGK